VIKTVNVCAWTYHLSTSQVVDVSTNYYDPNAVSRTRLLVLLRS
jgi:hypothetical protein